MGILSTGQAKHFALGGIYGEGEPPMKDFYNPTDGYQGNDPTLPPLQLTFPSPTQPPLGGYTIGDMQNNVEGVNPYYSIFDNNSNGLNFRYDQRIPEVPVNQQYTNQTSITLNPSTDNSGSQSFGNDYNAYLADAIKYQGKYRDAQAVDDAFTRGDITQQERDRLQLLSPEQLTAETKPLTDDQKIDMNAVKGMDAMRYMNPMGGDFTTNMYQLGRSLAAEKGTPYRGLGIGLNAGAGLLEAARGIGSGMAYQNMNNQTRNYYNDLMKRRQYTNASQTQNVNITGGVASGREGGLFTEQHFAIGGEQQPSEEEQMMMMQQQAQQQQGAPQEGEGMPQEGQQNPQEQMVQIAQQLVAGLQSLEAIDAYLKEQQVDEQTYNAIMQIAQQIIAEQEQAPTEEVPTMRNGGKFKHKVGDKIEFTHKGKKHKGVIKKIENGQIYL